jgi:hypothetical protein
MARPPALKLRLGLLDLGAFELGAFEFRLRFLGRFGRRLDRGFERHDELGGSFCGHLRCLDGHLEFGGCDLRLRHDFCSRQLRFGDGLGEARSFGGGGAFVFGDPNGLGGSDPFGFGGAFGLGGSDPFGFGGAFGLGEARSFGGGGAFVFGDPNGLGGSDPFGFGGSEARGFGFDGRSRNDLIEVVTARGERIIRGCTCAGGDGRWLERRSSALKRSCPHALSCPALWQHGWRCRQDHAFHAGVAEQAHLGRERVVGRGGRNRLWGRTCGLA